MLKLLFPPSASLDLLSLSNLIGFRRSALQQVKIGNFIKSNRIFRKALKKTPAKKAKKQVKKKAPTKKVAPKKTAPKKKAPAKKAPAKKAPAKKKPNRWLRGGLLGVVLLVFGFGMFALAFQVWKAPTLAKNLPSSTIAYAEGELELWHTLQSFMGQEELNADGIAWIPTKDESYESVHYTYADHSWVADKTAHVFSSLRKDEDFEKMRPNLPYDNDLFVFFRPSEFWRATSDIDFSELPITRMGLDFLSATLSYFPATGIVANIEEGRPIIQSYTTADKSLLNGDAYFHYDEKYQGNLLSYFPADTEFFIGGRNAALTFLQSVSILNAVDGLGGWALYLGLEEKFKYYFGNDQPHLRC